MGQSVVRTSSRTKIFSQPGSDPSLANRVTVLENNVYKVTYYEIISGASGSIAIPTGATVNAGEFGLSGNCILSEIDGSNKPTYVSPKTSGGVVVTSSLNTSTGAWVKSGTTASANVALIYSVNISALNYSNLNTAYIIDFAELDEALKTYNNLSDLSNVVTARNNLKQWDLFLTSGDQSTTSNVAANITELVTTTLTASKRYQIHGRLRISCNNTGGVKFQITVPSGATIEVSFSGSNTSNSTYITTIASASATLTLFSVQNFNGGSVLRIDGEVQLSSTAGTIQFGFASGTNTQTSTIYQLGSSITVKQLN